MGVFFPAAPTAQNSPELHFHFYKLFYTIVYAKVSGYNIALHVKTVAGQRRKQIIPSLVTNLCHDCIWLGNSLLGNKYSWVISCSWNLIGVFYWSLTKSAWHFDWSNQSPLYGRVTKKYDIYRNNNKKNLVTLASLRLLVQKKIFMK